MEVTNVKDYFLNDAEMDQFYIYVYEPTDTNDLILQPDAINYVSIDKYGKIKGLITQKYLATTINTEKESLNIKNQNAYVFVTNEDLPNKKHIFLSPKDTFNTEEAFYLGSESQKVTIPGESNSIIWTFNLQPLKELLKSNNVELLDKPKNIPTNKMRITFKNYSPLINKINLYDKNKNPIKYTIRSDYRLENIYANPISWNNNNIALNVPILDNNITMPPPDTYTEQEKTFVILKDYLKTPDVAKPFYVYDTLIDILVVNHLIKSNFTEIKYKQFISGLNTITTDETLIQQYKAKNVPKSAKDYSDFHINKTLAKLENSGYLEICARFKTLILALSENIESSYSFKGGFTTEHKFYLPWFISFNEAKNSFQLKSYLYDIQNDWKSFEYSPINNNYFSGETATMELNELPNKIEAQTISNLPLEFNKTSFNFNYLFSFLTTNNNQTIKTFINKFKPRNQKTREERFDLIAWDLDQYYYNNNEYFDRILRFNKDIPQTARAKLNTKNKTEFLGSATSIPFQYYYYNENGRTHAQHGIAAPIKSYTYSMVYDIPIESPPIIKYSPTNQIIESRKQWNNLLNSNNDCWIECIWDEVKTVALIEIKGVFLNNLELNVNNNVVEIFNKNQHNSTINIGLS